MKTGCSKKVRSGYCPDHQREHYQLQDLHRGNPAERGYDATWRKLRLIVLGEEPLCRACQERCRVTPATDVDHIRPFHGPADPLRLDRENLQPLCRSCHARKTMIESIRRVA